MAVAVAVAAIITLAMTSGPAAARAARAVSGSKPSAEITARRMRPRTGFPMPRLGMAIPGRDLFGTRVFTNGQVGFALANDGQEQFPARTTNGGRTWTIDGPQLHVDAADGPEAVDHVGIASRSTEFAYGPSVIDVSSDAGRTWWEAFPGGDNVTAVVATAHGLLALVQQSGSNTHPTRVATWQYVSSDGGRHWRYSTLYTG